MLDGPSPDSGWPFGMQLDGAIVVDLVDPVDGILSAAMSAGVKIGWRLAEVAGVQVCRCRFENGTCAICRDGYESQMQGMRPDRSVPAHPTAKLLREKEMGASRFSEPVHLSFGTVSCITSKPL